MEVEVQVGINKTNIAVLTQSCEDCKKAMENGLKRVEKNQEKWDKRMWGIAGLLIVLLGTTLANLLLAIK